MIQKESGFTLDELCNMDTRQKNTLTLLSIEKKKKERLQRVLDFADACRMALVSVNYKNGTSIYKRWHNRLLNEINPKQIDSVWDKIERNRKLKRKSRVIN